MWRGRTLARALVLPDQFRDESETLRSGTVRVRTRTRVGRTRVRMRT